MNVICIFINMSNLLLHNPIIQNVLCNWKELIEYDFYDGDFYLDEY